MEIRIVNNIHVHEQSNNRQIQHTVASDLFSLAWAVLRLAVALSSLTQNSVV